MSPQKKILPEEESYSIYSNQAEQSKTQDQSQTISTNLQHNWDKVDDEEEEEEEPEEQEEEELIP